MKSIYQKNIAAYEELYKTDDASRSYEVRVKVEAIKKSLPSIDIRSRILEIGYGTGDLLHNLSKHYKKSSIFGLEVVGQAEELYKRRFKEDKNVSLITGDAERDLNLVSNSYRMILASHMLEHIKNETALLRQVFEALKKGGYFILAVPDWGDFENHLHYRQYSKQKFLEIEKKYNWKLILLKGDGFYINKLFYKCLALSLARGTVSENIASEQDKKSKLLSVIRSLYYSIGVNILLKLNVLDTLLFSKIDKKPMQWIGIYKKLE